jgi:DNA-binding NarL/FixJ family response regulator
MLKRFGEALEILIRPGQYVRLDEEMASALQDLAPEERVASVRQIAVDMLRFSLNYQWTSRENMQAWEKLTPREQEVAAYVCLGYTNRQIAQKMVIAPSTVKTHVRNLLRKFRLHGKLELRGVLKDWDFGPWDGE